MAASLAAGGGSAANAAACSITWDGGGGTFSWHDPPNWDLDRLPGPADDVCIPALAPDLTITLGAEGTTSVRTVQGGETLEIAAGALSLSGATSETDSVVPQLVLSGGGIRGHGYLTVTERLTWNAGTLGGGMSEYGGVFLEPGAALDLRTSGPHVLDGYLRSNGPGTLGAGVSLRVTKAGVIWGLEGRLTVDGEIRGEHGSAVIQERIDVEPGARIEVTGHVRIGPLVNRGSVVVRGDAADLEGRVENLTMVEILDGATVRALVNAQGATTRVGRSTSTGALTTAIPELDNDGTLNLEAGTLHAGTLWGPVSTGRFVLGAETILFAGRILVTEDATFAGSGVIYVESHKSGLYLRGTTTLEAGVTLDHRGVSVLPATAVYLEGLLAGSGTYRWTGGGLGGDENAAIGPDIRFEIRDPVSHGGEKFRLGPSVALLNRATITITGWPEILAVGSDSTFRNEGRIVTQGGGSIGLLGVPFENRGVLELSADGRFTLTEPYTQSGDAELVLRADGANESPGRLVVRDRVGLGGTLRVVTSEPFPRRFTAVTFESRSGDFARIVSDLAAGRFYERRWLDDGLDLVVHDDTPPTNPTGVFPTPQTVGVWSPHPSVGIGHTGAADDLSGVDGFSFSWDTDPQGEPDLVKDVELDVSPIRATVPDGDSNYFHLRTVDKAGNWSGVLTAGPFFIDTTPPTSPEIEPGEIDRPVQDDLTIDLTWRRSTDAGSGMHENNALYHVGIKAASRADPWSDYSTGRGVNGESLTFDSQPGFNYCFRVETKDRVENRVRSAERCTAVPFDDGQLEERGAWTEGRGSGYYLGTFSRTTRRGVALEVRNVRATRLTLLATRCPRCGRVRVFLAGRLLREVNLAAGVLRKQQSISVASFAGVRTGKVRIEVVSSGKPVIVEGLAVVRPGPA